MALLGSPGRLARDARRRFGLLLPSSGNPDGVVGERREHRGRGRRSILFRPVDGEGNAMSTYVVLSSFTEKGVSTIKDTTKRAEDFKKAAKKAGVTVKELLWTQGQYDLVTVIEAQDESAAMALGLNVAKLGNLRSETLRAFTAVEMEKILEKVA